ncbi:hypothetical protein FUAX_41460 (plasmid) [Fulvitalea axinellae]|uniref:Ankyrin repeat domain-containing protein n=1 Tax=Fulvitalea axinellae TaxID=1182444 RepID=A0AAU9CHS6_9BACT|nr:hypothetical protein FUAX_41460 [Fulvitalea axinellae]
MKTLNTNPFKMTLPVILIALFFTSACANAKKEQSSKPVKIEKTVKKPKDDIQTSVIKGDLEAVKQHIKAGTDINQKEPMSGATPLISAATFNKPEIAKALIAAGADLSVKNNDGSTALHTAAFFGRIKIVQMLIDAKADKTVKNNYGATPRQTVLGKFADMKPTYEMLIQQLTPMGFTLDLKELEKSRTIVAMMLQ